MKKIKQLLIEWLMDEYSPEASEKQIKDATITEIKNVYKIKYSSGTVDIVQIKRNQVIQID